MGVAGDVQPWLGIASELESLTISMILPEWTYNIKSLRRAFAVRREMMAARNAEASLR